MHRAKPPHQRIQARAGLRPQSLASCASLARGGFLTIRDIWAGPAPRGHRHKKRRARRKHHLHIIKPLGGSQRLLPAAPVLPGESRGRHQVTRRGRGEDGQERGARLEFLHLAPLRPLEVHVTWAVSLPLPGTTGCAHPWWLYTQMLGSKCLARSTAVGESMDFTESLFMPAHRR